jgi:hypothetical protein
VFVEKVKSRENRAANFRFIMKFAFVATCLHLMVVTISSSPTGMGRVIVTNLAPNQGIFTPIWFGISRWLVSVASVRKDLLFITSLRSAVFGQALNLGSRSFVSIVASTPQVERLAEDVTTGPISALFAAATTRGRVLDATIESVGPIAPGVMVEFEFELEESDMDSDGLYFIYVSMVVPSVRDLNVYSPCLSTFWSDILTFLHFV